MAITAWAAKFAYQLDLLLGERPDLPSRTWHHYSYLKGTSISVASCSFVNGAAMYLKLTASVIASARP